ncbi:MAG: DUF4065 domain-containing protein [Bacteroidetes bacterium]|nr:DUF4065 domain-containing protein [Bacteroidota bacterium]
MSFKLTQSEIGQRLAALRKRKGLSQEDLARIINISRSSITQIELGKRGVDLLELQNLALGLGFSLDKFISKDFTATEFLQENIEPDKKQDLSERISKPKFQSKKFKNVLLYILSKCAGKPNVGETVLYKLLYFSDFNYYELYEEHLTGISYRKLPYGPVPKSIETILNQMIDAKQIQRIKTIYHDYPQTRYLPLEMVDLTQLKASEKEAIDHVIEQMSDWSASAISNYSHKDMPWVATKDGEEINYELVFYREAPFSVRSYGNEMESE